MLYSIRICGGVHVYHTVVSSLWETSDLRYYVFITSHIECTKMIYIYIYINICIYICMYNYMIDYVSWYVPTFPLGAKSKLLTLLI